MLRCSGQLIITCLTGCLLLILLTPALQGQGGRFTLQQCIDKALQENVNVITAGNNFKSARQDHLEAWGNALPSATTYARYQYNRAFGTQYVPDLGIYYQDPGTKSYATGVSLSMTLFDGGRTWFNIKRASELKGSYREQYESARQYMVLQIKQAYYGLLSSIMLKKVQADALARSKKQLEVTTTRYDLGSASLSEKLKQEVNVANDSLALLERENDIRNAEFNLNLLMNRDVSLPLTPVDTLGVVGFGSTVDEALATALRDNPSLKSSKADLSAAKASVRMSQSLWIPSVSAGMSWSWNTREANEWLKYKYDNGSYSFGITIGYTLFDAFTKKTSYSRSKLAANSYQERYNNELKSIAQDVRKAYLDIEKSQLQYQTALLAEKSAKEDLKLQEEKYRLGASSILELLDAQYSLTNAQYSRVLALYELNIAVASMAQAMGTE